MMKAQVLVTHFLRGRQQDTRSGGPDLPLAGPLAILGATGLMALQDALVKALSADLPLWQFFLLRSALILPVMVAVAARRDARRLLLALNPWVLLRAALIVATYVFFYAAMPVLPLPMVSAVYYSGPLWIVLLSAILLGDRVSLAQIAAIIMAFVGVLIVLRPTGDGFSMAALLPLASALSYALAMIVTRARVGKIDIETLTISLNLVFCLVALAGMGTAAALDRAQAYPFLLTAWVPLEARTATAIVGLSVLSVGVHLLLARAYQIGPTAVVAGLDFSYLVFAAIWAALLFGTVPSAPVILGTALIATAGLWAVVGPGRIRR